MRPFLLLILLVLCPATSPVSALLAAEIESASASAAVRAGYVQIEGQIDQGKAAYFKRTLDEARKRKLTHVVVHLTTPGGELGAGMEMLNAALAIPADGPRLIAFVDDHSLSAGSLIAYGHHEILVTNKAMLGDIGVITMGTDGKIEYLPEKIETVVRTLLRNAAQNRGWDQAKLVKMTARTQDLYRFDQPGGKPAFVIEDDLGTWLSAHPQAKAEDKVVVLGKDRLLSYTAREAVEQGMATALVADLDAAYARLGTTRAAVADLSPSDNEKLAWSLAGFAPLMASAALLFLFLEFKVPMGGLWLGLAAVAGVGFFVCQFYLDLAGYFEVGLIVLGIALILVDLLVLPTGGLLAAGGALLVAFGLVSAFMPNGTEFTPNAVGWGDSLSNALVQSLLAIGILTVGTTVIINALPRLALHTGMADAAAIDATSAGDTERGIADLAGRSAQVRSILRPSGQVEIDGHAYDAVSENGEYVPAGETVTVVAARFGELVVRKGV